MSVPKMLQVQETRPLPERQVLRHTLRADPRQEYFTYVPSSGDRELPLLVSVHGVSRNAEEQASLFSRYCEEVGAVLVAPRFGPEQHRDYQKLGRSHADLLLDSIVEEVASLTGAVAPRIHLFGYSGGAQFAHRYAMAHPHRIARAVIAAAGWYTFPDARRRYPYGIRPSPKLPHLRFDPEAFLRVPMLVLVGKKDRSDRNLRRSERLDSQQGVTRVERARNWVAAMKEAAKAYHLPSLVSLEEVSGSAHSFARFAERGALAERVFESLFGLERPRRGDGADHEPRSRAPKEANVGS